MREILFMRFLMSQADVPRHRSLLLMQAPERWTTWPFLPVARDRPNNAGCRQLGVLYDARHTSGTLGYSSTVFVQNLFALPLTEQRLLAGPKIVYDSLDLLLDDAWRVD
jgi:hypothetical protein